MTTVDSLLAQIWAVHQNGQVRRAEAAYRELVGKAPNNANAHVYLGIALFDLKEFGEAVETYRRALRLQPHFPIAWNNLGNALRMLGEIQEADQAFEQALQQRPDYTNAIKNRGTLWTWAGDLDRGLALYQQALQHSPDDYELHRNLGIILLLQRRFEEGWREYRWRWQAPGMARPKIPVPVWQGESLKGKTIFVYPEQGLGDAIQFARMIPQLRQEGADVVLGCEPKLVPLFSGLRGVGQIVPTGGEIRAADYQASLVDLMDHRWQGEAAISGLPYLEISENLQAFWQRQMGRYRHKKIGLYWQGNPQFHADVYRSAPLSVFAELFELSGIDWISLQFGFGSEQIADFTYANQLHRLPENIDKSGGAFLDTAAILKQLDLLITVDTSVAHLAGALGVPTWLLLSKIPDWRWGLDGTRTSWYDRHRLWRQQTAGDWQSVIHEMKEELSATVLAGEQAS